MTIHKLQIFEIQSLQVEHLVNCNFVKWIDDIVYEILQDLKDNQELDERKFRLDLESDENRLYIIA